jgi:hypothetical protein
VGWGKKHFYPGGILKSEVLEMAKLSLYLLHISFPFCVVSALAGGVGQMTSFALFLFSLWPA